VLDCVQRAVAWQRADQIRYDILDTLYGKAFEVHSSFEKYDKIFELYAD
jgi:hypothetical protein